MSTTEIVTGDIIALEDYRALYFAIPKVANSSMKAICADLVRPHLNDKIISRHWSDSWKPRLFRDEKARQHLLRRQILITKADVSEYADYWKFCFVRNPWDRLVSCWKEKIGSEEVTNDTRLRGVARGLTEYGLFHAAMPFGDFADAVSSIPDPEANGHFRSQHTFVSDARGKLLVDFVGRFEMLNADFAMVCRKTGMPAVAIPHLLRSSRKAYVDYYDSVSREKVRKRFIKDIEMFEYTFSDG